MAEWILSRLSKDHDRAGFSCGQPSLDLYLYNLATQYEKRHIGRTYVATEADSLRVAGYCTLSTGGLEPTQLTAAARRKLPKHQVPIIHIGRLAVDSAFQGRRLGEALLFHALHIALAASQTVGVYGVTVSAIDDKAITFYGRYGFTPLLDHPNHLLLPMRSVESMFAR